MHTGKPPWPVCANVTAAILMIARCGASSEKLFAPLHSATSHHTTCDDVTACTIAIDGGDNSVADKTTKNMTNKAETVLMEMSKEATDDGIQRGDNMEKANGSRTSTTNKLELPLHLATPGCASFMQHCCTVNPTLRPSV
uniref:Argininosuccinate synthase n=1 Tax=Lygus hesperus TaxID=30085 RepID=A0A0A9Z0Z9_LYGHE